MGQKYSRESESVRKVEREEGGERETKREIKEIFIQSTVNVKI